MDPYYEYSENNLMEDGEEYEDPHCHGCQQPIEDGSVVQFGEGIWHFECFRCAKCRKLVECYSNLLLLRDGSPICEDCSYSCHACSKTIKDEAIMTGEEAYHADCFRCVQCHRKIEDLVFTQTSKGIYCTQCHETKKLQRLKRKEEKDQLKYKNNLDYGTLNNNAQPTPAPLSLTTAATSTPVIDTSLPPVIPRINLPPSNTAFRTSSTFSIVNAYAEENGLTQSPILDTLNDINELNDMLMGNNKRSSEETLRNSTDQQTVSIAAAPLVPEDEIRELKRELSETKHRLNQVENKFSKIKKISRKALEEFNVVKESYAFEVQSRKEAEKLIIRLKSELVFYQQASIFPSFANFKQMSQDEIEMLNQQRADLELLCHEFRQERDRLTRDMESIILNQKPWKKEDLETYWVSLQSTYQHQLQSVQKDLQIAKSNYAKLIKGREDIISDMILLNTKNAELAQLNNDLSRRMIEKEQEATAVLAGLSFLADDTKNEKPSIPVIQPHHQDTHRKHHKRNLSTGSIGIVKPTTITAPSSSTSINKFSTASAATAKNYTKLSDDTNPSRVSSLSNNNIPKVAQRDSFNGSSVAAPKLFKFRKNKSISGKHNTNNLKENELVSSLSVTTESTTTRNDNNNDKSNIANGKGAGRKHYYVPFKFLRPVKCEGCYEKMWGVNELKCTECNMACHSKCVYDALQVCQGNSSHNKSSFDGFRILNDSKLITDSNNINEIARQPMFGNDLAKQVQAEKSKIPMIVQKCIECVELRGMDYEGIYRKSGAVGQIRQIQQAFDKGVVINLEDAQKWRDICDITSVLKQYFRELPNPLFTYELHSKFMNANALTDGEEKLRTISQLIQMLPIENFNTLKYLMEHLNRIQLRSKKNLMTSKNLAVVFGPTLLRDMDDNRDLLEMNHKIGIIDYILNHMDSLFVIETINNNSSIQSYNSAALGHLNRRGYTSSSFDLPRPSQQQAPAGYI
ncbi:hypothetical protein BDF20DRAFT_909846 [Mycotypha africana]|uniref:uncharacterized protein n=1 Tax=Mycotypha africana TaxID=64632 RepID=UPI002301EC22|nr:uncharacterized protein BDF20DRAFT_909846 [Mycotypha africana]KAI8992176.1 hypothetical protein BDF20DRAFT_909846 [Mycotypha africana]